jgi:hypothetical protein
MNNSNNNNSSNSSHSNISDENKNTLNNSTDSKKKQKSLQIKPQSHNKLNSLKHIFPFISQNTDEYKKNEFSNLVNEILSSNNNKNNNIKNSYLDGKKNIIDKIILKYSNYQGKNIKEISILKMKIDKNFLMMNEIGFRLPNLIELNLNGSEIFSVEEIGTNFQNLIKLNISNCKINDLNGICCFKKLQELDASFNNINDLIDLEYCNEIKILKLNNNKIEDIDNIFFLKNCEKLEKIYLGNNPIFSKYNESDIKNILNNNNILILN